MTNWCRLHDTMVHYEVNFQEMEKMVKIVQVDAPFQGTSNKFGGSTDTAMAYDIFEEELPFPNQEDNEAIEDVYDAQAFQTKGGHFLRNQNIGPFKTSAPPNNMVLPNQNADNNPSPPKGPSDSLNKGNPPSIPKYQVRNDSEFDFIIEVQRQKTSMSFFDILKWYPVQKEILLKALGEAGRSKGREKVTPTNEMNATLYKGKTGTPPFLLTLRIFRKKLHNCLLDYGASGNIMPVLICRKLGLSPLQKNKKVIQ